MTLQRSEKICKNALCAPNPSDGVGWQRACSCPFSFVPGDAQSQCVQNCGRAPPSLQAPAQSHAIRLRHKAVWADAGTLPGSRSSPAKQGLGTHDILEGFVGGEMYPTRWAYHAKNSAWYTLHNSSSPSMVQAFFCRSFRAPIPKMLAYAHSCTLCSCKMCIDPLGDCDLTMARARG